MAKTSMPTGDDLAVKVYNEVVFRDVAKESFFQKKGMMGSDGKAPVYVKTDLEKKRGEVIRMPLIMRLSGAGVTDGEVLEGNEEALTDYSLDLTLHQYRHAVRDSGAMDRKRAAYDFDEESMAVLKTWGEEKIDALIFNELGIGESATSTPTKVFYNTASGVAAGSAATAKAALTEADSKLQPNFISAVKAWVKTGGERQYIPVKPIRIDGKDYYVLLCHPDCLYDLKTNSTYQQFLREAEVRGKDNPLFTGAVAIIDGVVVHEHENCAVATDGGGAAVPWGKAVLMGQQAICWGWGQRPKMVEEEFDYQNEHGKSWNIIAGVKKSGFNSLDYGSVGVWLARTNISGL